MGSSVRLLVVTGSTRAGSTNTAVVRTAVDLVAEDVSVVACETLAELPAFNPDEGWNRPARGAQLRGPG